jgi:hypothetical protein
MWDTAVCREYRYNLHKYDGDTCKLSNFLEESQPEDDPEGNSTGAPRTTTTAATKDGGCLTCGTGVFVKHRYDLYKDYRHTCRRDDLLELEYKCKPGDKPEGNRMGAPRTTTTTTATKDGGTDTPATNKDEAASAESKGEAAWIVGVKGCADIVQKWLLRVSALTYLMWIVWVFETMVDLYVALDTLAPVAASTALTTFAWRNFPMWNQRLGFGMATDGFCVYVIVRFFVVLCAWQMFFWNHTPKPVRRILIPKKRREKIRRLINVAFFLSNVEFGDVSAALISISDNIRRGIDAQVLSRVGITSMRDLERYIAAWNVAIPHVYLGIHTAVGVTFYVALLASVCCAWWSMTPLRRACQKKAVIRFRVARAQLAKWIAPRDSTVPEK